MLVNRWCVHVLAACILNAPISSRNFISSTTFAILYAICMRNHHIIIGNVAAATSLACNNCNRCGVFLNRRNDHIMVKYRPWRRRSELIILVLYTGYVRLQTSSAFSTAGSWSASSHHRSHSLRPSPSDGGRSGKASRMCLTSCNSRVRMVSLRCHRTIADCARSACAARLVIPCQYEENIAFI